jgi:hypothetical protein
MTPDELQRVGMAVAEFVPEAALLAAAS